MLYVFVEGHYDESFFSKVFFGNNTLFVQYAQMKEEKVNSYIKSVKRTPGYDYLFFGDEDGKTIQTAADDLLKKYSELEQSKLFIVQSEIQSWYYAGVSENDCIKLKIKNYQYCTDSITKEKLIEKLTKPEDRQYVLARMLDCFSVSLAEDRNSSFKFFSKTRKEPAVAV